MTLPRLLISDVDRTLLTHDHKLPDRVADAVLAARAAGVAVVFATARSPAGLRPFAERLRVASLAICFNGGWIGDVASGVARHARPIPREDALEAMAIAQEAGVHPMWFTADGVAALAEDPVVIREAGVTREPVRIATGLDALPDAPGKILCVATSDGERAGFVRVRAALVGRVSLATSHVRLLEIGPLGVSKRAAAEAVAREMQVSRAECAAAGDAENDLEMLAWAGTAVTVGNAMPEIKRLTKFIGPSCDEGGLADAIAWLIGPRFSSPEVGVAGALEQLP